MAKSSSIKSVSELKAQLEDGKLYSRQEVATEVGCIWANVLEADREKRLDGITTYRGKTPVRMFTKDQIIAWRLSVENHTTRSDKKKLTIMDESELEELKKLLAGTKFESRL